MKKGLILLMLLIASVISIAANRSLMIQTGYTMPNAFTLGASDTINESETVTFTITNLQKYAQNQVFTVNLTDISGTPNVTITAYGKVTSSGSWVQIGSPITWTSDSNDGSITSTAPINYNYLKVTFVADAGDQQSKIVGFEVKTSNAFEVPTSAGTITFSRPTTGVVTLTSKDDDANAGLTVDPGGTGALILGGSTGTVEVTSSAWDISTAGAVSGVTSIANSGTITTTTDADTYVVDMGTDLHAVDINVNSASKFSVDTVGNVAAAGVVQAGYRQPTVITNTDGTETLDATMSGKTCVLTKSDGASTVTIPDASASTVGVVYYIIQTADQNFTVTSTTANNNGFVCDNVATSDAVTCSTASHLIGSGMIVIGISATKWYVGALNPEELLTPEAAD